MSSKTNKPTPKKAEEVEVESTPASATGTSVALLRSGTMMVPDDLAAEYAELSGAGQENITATEMLVPELKVLQKMSPACDPDDTAYITGAVPGMFMNSLNNKLYDGKKGVLIIPIYYTKHFVEFVPITKGGGFVADHGDDRAGVIQGECKWNDELKMNMRGNTGNQVIETHQFVSIIVPENYDYFPSLMRFSGSKIKQGKKINTLSMQKTIVVNGVRMPAPLFGAAYSMVTLATENESGKFYITDVADACATYAIPDVGRDIFNEAKKLYKGLRGGTIKTQGFEEANAAKIVDEEIPF